MRLAAQAKGGYYAAAPEGIAAVLERLRPSEGGLTTVLDPCAGEGRALMQFTGGLGATPYAVELAENRAETVRALLPEGQAIHADFLTAKIHTGCFSFVWCNPPFDYATGGSGRVEGQFVDKAKSMLAPRGVLALCCPERIARSYSVLNWFDRHLEDVSALVFPEEHRPYNETVLIGRRRRDPLEEHEASGLIFDELIEQRPVYLLPPGEQPLFFHAYGLTDDQLVRLMRQRPLDLRWRQADELKPLRPPMTPGEGHLAMLLAAGLVDGLVERKGEPPHVVRGVTHKMEIHLRTEVEQSETSSKTRQFIGERMNLVIRTLTHDGRIVTISDAPDASADPVATEEETNE
ncbi:MAG: DUF6094 domain-containing protein [Planctomycetota bacterium]